MVRSLPSTRLTRRSIVAGLAGGSVLPALPWRAAVEFGHGLRWIEGIGLSSLVLSASALGVGILGQAVSWVLILYLAATYIPQFFATAAPRLAADWRVRVFVGMTSVYFGLFVAVVWDVAPAVLLAGLVPAGDVTAVTFAVGYLGGIGVATLCLAGYLAVGDYAPLTDPDGEVFALVQAFVAEDVAASVHPLDTYPTPLRPVVAATRWALPGIIVVLPCLAVGFLATVASGYYPVFEAVVLVGTAALGVGERAGIDVPLPDRERLDVEDRLLRHARETTRSYKGMMMTMFCVLGLLLSMGLFLVAVLVATERGAEIVAGGGRLVDGWASMERTAALRATLALSGLIGLPVSFVAAGVHGLVYWFRQLQQLGPYLTYWERVYGAEESPRPPPPTTAAVRPPLLTLPTVMPLWVAVAGAWIGISAALLLAFGLTWPLIVGVMGWSLRHARRTTEQSLAHVSRDVFLGLAVTVVVGLGIGGPAVVAFAPEIVTGGFLIGGLYFTPELTRIGTAGGSRGRTRATIYIGLLLGLLLGLLWLGDELLPPWFRWLGTGLSLSLGALLTLKRAIERRASAP
jgi:hypothetical protein